MPVLDPDTPPGELPEGSLGTIHHAQFDEDGGRALPPNGYQITDLDAIYLALSAAGENPNEPGRTLWCMIRRFVGKYYVGAFNSLKRLVETFSQPINPAWAYITHYVQSRTLTLPPSSGIIRTGNNDQQIPGEPLPSAARRAVDHWLESRGRPHRYSSRGTDPDSGRGRRRRNATSSSIQERRQRKIEKAKVIYQGGNEGRAQWRSVGRNARRAIYSVLTGRSGFPAGFSELDVGGEVQSFDDFASYEASFTDIRNMSDERLTNPQWLTHGDTRRVRFHPNGEWYVWNSIPQNYGEVYIIGPNGEHDSRQTNGAGELFAITSEDREATQRRNLPEAPGGGGSSGGDGWMTSTTTENVNFDVWNILPNAEMNREIRRWVDESKGDLQRRYRGKRRNF